MKCTSNAINVLPSKKTACKFLLSLFQQCFSCHIHVANDNVASSNNCTRARNTNYSSEDGQFSALTHTKRYRITLLHVFAVICTSIIKLLSVSHWYHQLHFVEIFHFLLLQLVNFFYLKSLSYCCYC
jgi:hypothetical protein